MKYGFCYKILNRLQELNRRERKITEERVAIINLRKDEYFEWWYSSNKCLSNHGFDVNY